jgi:hypothetical protein
MNLFLSLTFYFWQFIRIFAISIAWGALLFPLPINTFLGNYQCIPFFVMPFMAIFGIIVINKIQIKKTILINTFWSELIIFFLIVCIIVILFNLPGMYKYAIISLLLALPFIGFIYTAISLFSKLKYLGFIWIILWIIIVWLDFNDIINNKEDTPGAGMFSLFAMLILIITSFIGSLISTIIISLNKNEII